MYSGGNPRSAPPEGGSDNTTTTPASYDGTNNFLTSFSKPGEQFSFAKSLTDTNNGSSENDNGGTLNVDASSLFKSDISGTGVEAGGTGTGVEVADGTGENDGTNGDGAPGRAVEAPATKPTDATLLASNTDGTGGPSDSPSRSRSPGGFRGADGTRGGGC